MNTRGNNYPYKNYIIIPPEASASWVLNDSILFSLLTAEKIYIDTQDIRRYERLAKNSFVDFLVSYLFSILKGKKILEPLTYPNYFTLEERKHSLGLIESIYKLLSLDEAAEKAVKGYKNYIEYARSESKGELYKKFDKKNFDNFALSKEEAINQLNLIESGKFPAEELKKYINRLFMKMICADVIRRRIEKRIRKQLKIFDSHEYIISVQLLEKYYNGFFKGLNERFVCPGKQDKRVLEQLDNILTILKLNSTLPLLISAAEHSNFFESFKKDLLNLDEGEIISEAHKAKNQLKAEKGFKWSAACVVSSGIALFSCGQSWIQAAGGISFLLSLIELVKTWKEKSGFSECPDLAKFLAFAMVHTPHLSAKWWVSRFKTLLKQPTPEDQRWAISQRIMKAWTDDSIYVPWFENISIEDYVSFMKLIKTEDKSIIRYF